MSLKKHQRTIGASVFLFSAALVVASWHLYGRYYNYNRKDDFNETRQSKCFILTPEIMSKVDNWEDELTHDVAVLVPLEHIDLGQQLRKLIPSSSYKIITFMSDEAMWSTIRHLKKNILILDQSRIEKIPDGLNAYVAQIVVF